LESIGVILQSQQRETPVSTGRDCSLIRERLQSHREETVVPSGGDSSPIRRRLQSLQEETTIPSRGDGSPIRGDNSGVLLAAAGSSAGTQKTEQEQKRKRGIDNSFHAGKTGKGRKYCWKLPLTLSLQFRK